MKLAPIILFTYNKPDETLSVLNSLKKNVLVKKSTLYIFSDNFNPNKKDDYFKVQITRQVIKNLKGFKKVKIIFRNKNFGLYNNITKGLDFVFSKHSKAIILEDDILVSSNFLEYMNKSLDHYRYNEKIGSICGNCLKQNEKLPNTYFLLHQDCWGWATWRRAWKYYDHDSKKLISKIKNLNLEKKFNIENQYDFLKLLENNLIKKRSWAVNWYASLFINNKLNLYCSNPKSQNIGLNENAENTKSKFKIINLKKKNVNENFKLVRTQESRLGYQALINFYKENQKNDISKLSRLKKKINWIFTIIKNFLFRKKDKFRFFGPFKSWSIAKKKSRGYDDAQIIKKTLDSALKVKKKQYIFERDSVLFNKPAYNWKILYYILKNSKSKINIIDFGGSLGSTYFQHKKILESRKSIKWNIIEQENIVKYGKKYFQNNNIRFYNKLEDALKSKAKIVLMIGVLQYLEEPMKVIKLLNKHRDLIIIIDKILFTDNKEDLILIQKTPKRIYDASYPIKIFSKTKFLNSLKKFKIIENKKNDNPFYVDFKNKKYKFEYLVLKS